MAQVNQQLLEQYKRGKTAEQQKVIDYFCKEEGCFSKNITDDAYVQMVINKRDSLKLRQKALSKIGLDEDEVSEIPPAMFEGYVFEKALAKRRANGSWVSSSYQVAWLFFSSSQVYIYRYTFNMDNNMKQESTDEFFYKDVTSFSTSSETETAHSFGNDVIKVETNKFKMVVPGDKIFVSMDGVSNSEEIIQAMKQKLREKKM